MLTLIIFSALMGWCGTPPRWPWWPWWWPPKPPFPPPPEPGPDPGPFGPRPHPWLTGILSIVGGIIAGYLMHYALPSESYLTYGAAAFGGGRFLCDIGMNLTKKSRA